MSDVLDLTTFKTWARTDLGSDDGLNNAAIDAATAWFGHATGRTFTLVTDSTTATARTYRPENDHTDLLRIHDAAEITSVVESSTSLTANLGYVALPFNNMNAASNWRPYDLLQRIDAYWYTNGARATVTVTAKWGWTTFDPLIGEALKVLAKDWATVRNTSFGIQGVSEAGFSVGIRQNPLVMAAVDAVRGPKSWGIA